MKRSRSHFVLLPLLLAVCLTLGGAVAYWQYYFPAEDVSGNMTSELVNFKYGLIYISEVSVSGSYTSADVKKTGELTVSAEMMPGESTDSYVTAEITFYNSTNVSYYYDKTTSTNGNDHDIVYSILGIEQKDEIPAETYKTITLTFTLENGASGSEAYSNELQFHFTVDKSSIGDIVAKTAVDRFKDILNNIVAEDSYEQLTTAMDNRSGWNKGSSVTYIGNVAGADSGDSAVINDLFGNEFMSMDLDGDGDTEPITIMIKRQDIDGNASTGSSYTYSSWGRDTTVNGCEMTLYITSTNYNGLGNGDSVPVYAAAFTLLPGDDEWTELVPLTKGTASANNYSGGWGAADSFNTDTWLSESNEAINSLAQQN